MSQGDPRHVAIIMDGNGRWAKTRGLARTRGHAEGVESVRTITRACARRHFEQLTLYAFSEENWKRPKREVNLLMRLLRRFLIGERDEIMENNIRLTAVGRIDRMPREVSDELDKTREMSAGNDGMNLCLALSYGGRQELLDAMKRIGRRMEVEEISSDDITEELITAHLYQPNMPPPDLLIRTAVQLTRLANGSVPSLRRAVADAMGYDRDRLFVNRGRVMDSATGETGGELLGQIHSLSEKMVADLILSPLRTHSIESIQEKYFGKAHRDVTAVLAYIRDDLHPRLLDTRNELTACLQALEGRFVPPGPSGAPSRGQAHILPSGRNFYSVDPQKIPTPAAWEVGKKLADALIEKYRQTHDHYPENVGLILWASPTMRSKGDDVAEILYLLGVRPVWQAGSGNVRGVEIIPAAELGRPRIDVTPRISGIFRDAFPLLVDLIDNAVQMVAALEEKPEHNFIRGHVIRDMADFTADGLDEKSAFRQATFRIFGSPPGSYGAGVAQLVESKAWESVDDLGRMYIRWSSYAYGQNTFGEPAQSLFHRHLGRISVTVKNEDTREKDMMACTDFYNYHGGLITAVHAIQGKRPVSMAGDAADPDHVKVRTTAEEARHIFRSRLLNPAWLEGLKRHGYKGAGDISKAMDIILGWDATADVVDDFLYQRFARKTALDPKMQEWMKSVNPYALQNILDKLLEAVQRGMWKTDENTLAALREAYLDVEGEIEAVTDD